MRVNRAVPFLFPAGARLGEHNAVLHANAKRHTVEGYAGPASIKTVLRGSVSWLVGGRQLIVDPSSFLMLGAGEIYSMSIDVPTPVETCCAFFAPGFLEQIAADLTSTVAEGLDGPDRITSSPAYLGALHRDRERALCSHVWSLAKRCEQSLNPSGTEEDFLLLALSLLGYYDQIREQSARVPAMRSSTRQELFRRLLVGREYIHSHSSGPLSLKQVSRAACLSPFHFHRGFTLAFGETPHRYVTSLRLSQARHMLESGSGVLEACINVGFSSASAFSRLFGKQFGSPPSSICPKFARTGKPFSATSPRLDS